jgi:D-glycero-alpha-D-manno-heptose-7-phosphate kinase
VTVNAAIPVTVRVEMDLSAPRGAVVHEFAGTTRVHHRESAAVDLTAAVLFTLRPQGGIRVRVVSQPGVGSGLGGSSAYAIALAKGLEALMGEEMDDRRLVGLLRDLEARILGAPTGVQDHWPGIFGGVLAIHFELGGDRIELLDVDHEWLARRMTVFDTGIAHHSGQVNWQVIRRRLDGDRETRIALGEIAEAATRCRERLLQGDETGVAGAIAAEWQARRRLAPDVCPSELQRLEEIAAEQGATAFKACGAGGGGSVLLWHSADGRQPIIDGLCRAVPSGRVVATAVAGRGAVVRR